MPQQSFSRIAQAKALVKRLEKAGNYSADIGVDERTDHNFRKHKVYTVRYTGVRNPGRSIRRKSLTIRNAASVKITQSRDGRVQVSVRRKNRRKR